MKTKRMTSLTPVTGCWLLILALRGCDFSSLDFGTGLSEPSAPASTVMSIAIIPDTVHLSVGQSYGLRAVVKLTDGSTLRSGAVHWSASDASVAAVSPATGLTTQVTATASGATSVTASYASRSAEAQVFVR